MTDQIHNQSHYTVAIRPIVRPLPMPDAEGIAGRREDVAGMTAGLPLLVDTGWYARRRPQDRRSSTRQSDGLWPACCA